MTVTSKQKLVDLAIEQIKADLAKGDLIGLDALLWCASEWEIIGILSEGRTQEYWKEKQVS